MPALACDREGHLKELIALPVGELPPPVLELEELEVEISVVEAEVRYVTVLYDQPVRDAGGPQAVLLPRETEAVNVVVPSRPLDAVGEYPQLELDMVLVVREVLH